MPIHGFSKLASYSSAWISVPPLLADEQLVVLKGQVLNTERKIMGCEPTPNAVNKLIRQWQQAKNEGERLKMMVDMAHHPKKWLAFVHKLRANQRRSRKLKTQVGNYQAKAKAKAKA